MVGALFDRGCWRGGRRGGCKCNDWKFLNIFKTVVFCLRTWDFHFQVRLFRSSLRFLSCSASRTSWILSGQEMELVYFLGSYPKKQKVVTLKTYIQTNKASWPINQLPGYLGCCLIKLYFDIYTGSRCKVLDSILIL